MWAVLTGLLLPADLRGSWRCQVKLSGKTITQLVTQNYCLVIVPTYNESMNIERLLAAILAQGPQFDILVVDDNSPDGTGDIVARIAEQTPRVQLLRRSGKLGLGTAYIAGFKYALQRNYAYIVQMDGDFSHRPEYLPYLLLHAEDGLDLVIGSRNVIGGGTLNWPRYREFISKGGSLYARLVLNMPIYDCTGGFKCFRAAALQQIDLDLITSNGYAFQIEMNYRAHQAGLKIKEMPIIFVEREAGVSKMSNRIIREAAWKVLRLRFLPNPNALQRHEMLPEKMAVKN